MTEANLKLKLNNLVGKRRAARIGVVPAAGGQFSTLTNTASPDAATDFLALISGIINGFDVAQAKVKSGEIKLSPEDAARLGEARNAAVALGSFALNSFREVGK